MNSQHQSDKKASCHHFFHHIERKKPILFAFTVPSIIGCGGNKAVPALAEPGKDPSAEQQTNWMEESKKRGGGPRKSGAPKKDATTK
jgi:hypothetical protein